MSKLPPLAQGLMLYVDATPDEGYPIRILRAYRENYNSMWTNLSTGEESEDPQLRLMNEENRQRAKILDKAIAILAQAIIKNKEDGE